MLAINSVAKRNPRVPVEICGGVLNYCDPTHYRDIVFPENRFFRVAVGIHPRQAKTVDPVTLADLQKKLCDPRVVGVSEVGLDYTAPVEEWPAQVELMKRILGLGITGKVLIIHMRGEQTDPANYYPSKRIRGILADCQVSTEQRIHIHCCQLSPSEMDMWLRIYPQCYFGFSSLTASFGMDQEQALRAVPRDRLLITTDSPHLPFDRFAQPNTPAYVGEVAEVVARLRKTRLETLLEDTRQNTIRLYGPWELGS